MKGWDTNKRKQKEEDNIMKWIIREETDDKICNKWSERFQYSSNKHSIIYYSDD